MDANYPVQRPSPVDGTGNFYFLRYNQLRAVNSATGATDDRGAVTIGAGRDRMVLRATLSGDAGGWLLAYDPAGTVTALETTTLQQHTYRVEFAPTKLKIKSLGFGSGRLMVGGFGGSSLAMVDLDLSQRSQYPAVPYGAAVIGEVEGPSRTGSTSTSAPTPTVGSSATTPRSPGWTAPTPRSSRPSGPTYRRTARSPGPRPAPGPSSAPSRSTASSVASSAYSTMTAGPRAIVSEPVADQSIVSLAAAGDVVYGGTSRWGGLGATPTQSSAKVFAYNAATGKLLWQVAPAAGHGGVRRRGHGADGHPVGRRQHHALRAGPGHRGHAARRS